MQRISDSFGTGLRTAVRRTGLRRALWACAVAVPALCAAGGVARAEVIELVGGRTVQGKVLTGQTTDEALALQLFDTGGVISIKWSHIIPARAKELRSATGFGDVEETEYLVPGHRVLLVTNKVVEGRALNPDEKDKPLQLKSRSSVTPYERNTIARIDETMLPGLLIYTPRELYDMRRDENPPDSPASNLDMAKFCMQIGEFDKAREHLDAAKDPAFLDTPPGRQIAVLERQLELLMKSKGAQDLVTQIKGAMRSQRWNEALAQLNTLDEQYKDEQVRKLINFTLLESQVVHGRDHWFQKVCQTQAYKVMGNLILAKARERKPLRPDENQPRGVAAAGTLAAARQWASRDLPKALWDKLMSDLDLKQEELDAYWKDRSGKSIQTASYGSGSFIVVKKVTAPKGAGGAGGDTPRRRPPGAPGSGSQGGPPVKAKEDKPKTEEEWWDALADRPGDRAKWLTAWFVESSGIFEIVRTDESELCGACGGRGVNVSNNSDGTTSSTVCTACNGAAKIRKVLYR